MRRIPRSCHPETLKTVIKNVQIEKHNLGQKVGKKLIVIALFSVISEEDGFCLVHHYWGKGLSLEITEAKV